MAAIKEYKCPCCGGAVEFDSKIQKIKCPYCDTEFDTEAFTAHEEEVQNAKPDEMDWETTAGGAWEQGEESTLRSYVCNSCGGEIVCDENHGGDLLPVLRQPDRHSRAVQRHSQAGLHTAVQAEQGGCGFRAQAALQGKGCCCPSCSAIITHIEELRGIYVPFWLFDGEAEGSANYMATTTRVFRHGDTEITETSFYEVQRVGTLPFSRVPVDASRKMPDDYMDSIEPFDYAGLKPFSTAYLPGFFADKFDVSIEESSSRADKRCRQSLSDALQGTTRNGRPYTSVTPTGEDIHLNRTGVHYALLPVWMLHTKWQGKDYLFAMNGQTGKLVGDLPVDKRKVAAWFAGISVPLMILLAILL